MLSLAGGDPELGSHHLYGRVVGQFEIVDAGHDGREIVVCVHVGVERLADHGEGRRQRFET